MSDSGTARHGYGEITDLGTAVYWPDIDEEIGLAGLLGATETLLEEAVGFTIYNRCPSDR